MLRKSVDATISRVWPQRADHGVKVGSAEAEIELQEILRRLYGLSPATDVQKRLQGNARTLVEDMTQVRWLALGQREHSIPMPFLVVLVLWLSMIFFGFNLFTPNSKLVAATMFAGALCVSSAIFLILELDSPFQGLLQISPAPLLSALARLGGLP